MGRGPRVRAAAAAVVMVTLAGVVTVATGGRATAVETPVESAVQPAAATLEANVTGPVTGGKGYPFRSAVGIVDLAGAGYAEEEYFLDGTASAYTSAAPLSADGRWTATPATTAPYKTRALVRRPTDPARFNGTVIVEWLNVTAGHDTAPDFDFAYAELLRSGFAWVGISVQAVSQNGSPPFLPFGLKTWDPVRYGSLTHPGDSYSYDIFSQAGRAVEAPGSALLGGLVPQRVIADGESQSASRMVTYINAIHPLAQVFDGFLVHSRGGRGAALSQGPLPSVPAPAATFVRTDLTEPVFVVQTETDVPGTVAVRQPDGASYHRWEIAGTAHADWWFLSQSVQYRNRDVPTYPNPACSAPVNDGPQHWVFNAAVSQLDRWVRTGQPPATGADVRAPGGVIQRDAVGNALGGIRTPQLDVPLATLSGVGNTPAGFCGLFGTSKAFTPDQVDELYRNDGAYVSKFVRAANRTFQQGFFLEADLDAIKSAAAESKRTFVEPPKAS